MNSSGHFKSRPYNYWQADVNLLTYQNIIKQIRNDPKKIMQNLSRLSLIALIIMLMVGFFVTPVYAAGTATRTEIVCTTGSYGAKDCHEVVQQIPTHTAKDIPTALPNLNLAIAAIGLVALLSTASYIYSK